MDPRGEHSSPSKREFQQVDHLFESLLPFRILAHATLAIVYVPTVVAYITIEHTPRTLISLLTFAILGILGLMCVPILLACTPFTDKQLDIRDYLAFRRNINTVLTVLFTVVDVLLVLVLPLCLWDISIQGFKFATDFDNWDKGIDSVDTEFGILTLIPVILSLLYLTILSSVALHHKKSGFQSLLYTPAAVAGESHREGMEKHCSHFLFHHSYFRKHEYVVWCIL